LAKQGVVKRKRAREIGGPSSKTNGEQGIMAKKKTKWEQKIGGSRRYEDARELKGTIPSGRRPKKEEKIAVTVNWRGGGKSLGTL